MNVRSVVVMDTGIDDSTVRLCPICAHNAPHILFRPRSAPGPIAQCTSCAMVYVSHIVDDHALISDGPVGYGTLDPSILTSCNLEDVAGSWELRYLAAKEREWPALRHNAVGALQRIARHLQMESRPPRLLDFGSGLGFFLAAVQEWGWEAHGLEPLPASAVYTRAKLGVPVVTDVLREDTFAAGMFDVVTAFQVFEHLPNPGANLGILSRSLRHGGIILIEVPNIATPLIPLMRGHHRHFVQDHLNFFSGKTLSSLLKMKGFEILEIYYPTRQMSFDHLITHWGTRYLGRHLSMGMRAIGQRLGVLDLPIGVQLRDIVAVIARKI